MRIVELPKKKSKGGYLKLADGLSAALYDLSPVCVALQVYLQRDWGHFISRQQPMTGLGDFC